MSGTYWSVQDCAWVPCEGRPEACADPLSVVTDVVAVPSQREAVTDAVPVPVDA